MYAPDQHDEHQPKPKFDFQHIDTKLYLALRNICNGWVGMAEDAGNRNASEAPDYLAAMLAMEEFELNAGGIPDWAIDRNWAYELVPGAQLCTKDGRRTGNAHIIRMVIHAAGPVAVPLYECLTDAGSKFTFNEVEILDAFTIGDWISDVDRVLKNFDRNGVFADQPQ